MSAICICLNRRPRSKVISWLLVVMAALAWPVSVRAGVSASLSWTASSDPNVTGYNIYYGGASRQYTNMVSVAATTTAAIPGLLERTIYYFSAKAHNAAGDESAFSNEAAFAGVTVNPNTRMFVKTLDPDWADDPVAYAIGAGAPAGMSINPTNGIVSWIPGREYASSTNYITIVATDAINPTETVSETLVIVVRDYLAVDLGSTAIASGTAGTLPISVAASSTVTNLQVEVEWPENCLTLPNLKVLSSAVTGTLSEQDGRLIIQLSTTGDQPLSGTNQVAALEFQSMAGLRSAILPIRASAGSGTTADGNDYANVQVVPGEVAVVGDEPMMRAVTGGSTRALTLFANPGTYEVQRCTNLQEAVWSSIATCVQTNIAQVLPLDTSEPVVFYRLHQIEN